MVLELVANVLDADGAFTTAKGVVCSAMTADCLPVILTDTKGTQVAAVHAGWRGLAGGILKNAVAKFSNLDSDNQIIAWLVLLLVKMSEAGKRCATLLFVLTGLN